LIDFHIKAVDDGMFVPQIAHILFLFFLSAGRRQQELYQRRAGIVLAASFLKARYAVATANAFFAPSTSSGQAPAGTTIFSFGVAAKPPHQTKKRHLPPCRRRKSPDAAGIYLKRRRRTATKQKGATLWDRFARRWPAVPST
jgi:hypothetical protein